MTGVQTCALPISALALGRDETQIADMLSGDQAVDEDLDMKVHGLAQERGIELS